MMSHRKWKETKQEPSMLPGLAVPGCCLFFSHFLWAIHPIRPVRKKTYMPTTAVIPTSKFDVHAHKQGEAATRPHAVPNGARLAPPLHADGAESDFLADGAITDAPEDGAGLPRRAPRDRYRPNHQLPARRALHLPRVPCSKARG